MNNRTFTLAALIAGLIAQSQAHAQIAVASGMNTAAASSASVTPKTVKAPPGTTTTRYAVTPGTLPGQVALQTFDGHYVTARNGGGQVSDALITTATSIGPDERFTVEKLYNYTLFKTADGHFVATTTGVTNTASALQTVADVATDSTLFTVTAAAELPGIYPYQFTTYYGLALAALNGGGMSTGAFTTGSGGTYGTSASNGYFRVQQCGDLGSGLSYSFAGQNYAVGQYYSEQVEAFNGGGEPGGALTFNNDNAGSAFKFIRQADGLYGLQTSNGVNYLTAINAGGLASGANLATDRTVVQAWEEFKLVDAGNCVYTIQTYDGYYLGFSSITGQFSTDIINPRAPPKNYVAYFELTPLWY